MIFFLINGQLLVSHCVKLCATFLSNTYATTASDLLVKAYMKISVTEKWLFKALLCALYSAVAHADVFFYDGAR